MRLGRSELMVTRVGFGGIPIQRLPEDEAVAVVRHCLDRGVNYIDTAYGYGTSEERIGKAIAGRRQGLVLATKSPARDRAGFLAHVDLSLERLGVDYIDLYQLHNVASDEAYAQVLRPGGAMDGAREAQRAGKIGHIGFTSHSLEIAKRAVRSGRFETIMFPFNFVAREPGEELYPLAVEHDVGFVAMKPLAGGMLNRAELAFKYVAQFPRAVPIPGIEKVEEIDEIVEVVSGSLALSKAEAREIERIRTELGNRFCRRCEYCQPCPQGVSVSILMQAESVLKRMPFSRFLGWYQNVVDKAVSDCERCRQCEDRCPYGLPILEMMDESIALYRHEKAKYEASAAPT
jgi:predicted aldo/keto reductase-like oxidoreductase